MDSHFHRKMRYDEKFYAKRAFSRFFLGYTVLYITAIAVLYASVIIIRLLLPFLSKDSANLIVDLFNDSSFGIFYPYALLYLVGLPIMYLLIKNVRTWKIEKKRLGIGMFLVLFFVNFPFTIMGSLIGTHLTDYINSLLGLEGNGLFTDIPLWVMAVLSLVIAPIFEELIFRKLLMDRIGVYGAWLSVIVSGLAFGAFHGTFEQLFYAISGGILFAIAYAKTGKIRYSMALHFMFNLFGAMIPLLVQEYMLSSTDFYYLLGILIILATQYGFALVGIVLFILGLCRGWFSLENPEGTVKITSSRARIMFFNLGSVAFTLLTAFSILVSFMPLADWIALIGSFI